MTEMEDGISDVEIRGAG
ncbi:hypothetical protein EE612_027677 [Oryza sativa]|nr:hypothetical protein EE612_027677 [Oryza sativa]